MRIHARGFLSTSAAAALIAATPVPAIAQVQTFNFDIPAQSLDSALRSFARTSRQQILFDGALVKGKRAPALSGEMTADQALARLLAGSGLSYRINSSGAITVMATPRGNVGTAVAGIDGGSATVATGTVVDARTGANLKGALVELEETGQTTSTDDLGTFRFPALRPGTYTVRISYLGYQDIVAAVEVGNGAGARQFAMTGGGEGREIIVYGSRSARAQALNQERTAENVQTVISGDLLGDFTGTTLSESLRRAPGVIFERDPATGDGTNIAVRGLSPDFSTVKFNGVELPEGSGVGRSASLSNILTESINKVTLSKTLLPNQDSSGTGALIEIETKTPFDRPRRYAAFTLEGAKRGNNFNEELLASGTVSGLFGANEQFGLSASFQYRHRRLKRVRYDTLFRYPQYLPLQVDGTTGVRNAGFVDPRTPFPFEPGGDEVYPFTLSISRGEVNTDNLGLTLSAGWAPATHTKLFSDFQRLDQRDTDYSSNISFEASLGFALQNVISLGGEQRRALTWLANQRLSLRPTYNYVPHRKTLTDVYSFRGETEAGQWRFKYLAGYTDGRKRSDDITLYASTPALNIPGNYLLPEAMHPVEGRVMSPFPLREPGDNSFPEPLLNDAGFDLVNSAQTYRISFIESFQTLGRNDRTVGEASAKFLAATKHLNYVEFGLAHEGATYSDKRPYYYNYNPLGGVTLADVGLQLSNASLDDIGIATRIKQIARDDILHFLQRQLPSLAVDCEPPSCPSGTQLYRWVFQADPRHLKKKTDEGETSVYLQTSLEFGELEMIGGARVSRVEINAVNLNGPQIFFENFQPDVEFYKANLKLGAERVRQTEILPRVLMNLRPRDNIAVRAGYYLAVARPQISLMSQTPGVQLILAPFYGPNGDKPALFVTKGNPDLKPARTHSFDVSAEYYDKAVGVLKIGAFYKRIRNLMESTTTSGETTLADVASSLPDDPRFQDVIANPANYFLWVSFPKNNPSAAHIWGIEGTLEKQFTFLPGAWQGLGLYANYTYTDSSKDQPITWGRSPVVDQSGTVVGFENAEFIVPNVRFNGQATHSGSIGLTYNKYGVDASLAYTWQSRRQLNFAEFNLHNFEEAYGTLDLRAEYRFRASLGDFRVYLEGLDLLRDHKDAALENSVGADDRNTPKYYNGGSYFGGRQFRVGIAANF